MTAAHNSSNNNNNNNASIELSNVAVLSSLHHHHHNHHEDQEGLDKPATTSHSHPLLPASTAGTEGLTSVYVSPQGGGMTRLGGGSTRSQSRTGSLSLPYAALAAVEDSDSVVDEFNRQLQ